MDVTRRQFLIANGVALALPSLPSLAAAESVSPSKKFVLMYVPNGLVRRCFIPGEEQGELPGFRTVRRSEAQRKSKDLRPAGVHPLELTSTMQPLARQRKGITLLTGLDRPYKLGGDAHEQGASCFLSCISPDEAAKRKLRFLQGRTLDHVIGDRVGQGTAYKTLEISCNGFARPKESPRFDNISWFDVDRVAPSIKDPQKLYQRLFSTDKFGQHVVDVTDLVVADAKTLSRKLAREDRHTMAEYIESVRNIEIRIDRLRKKVRTADIKQPPTAVLPRGEYIRLMTDMMLAAMQAGVTNVSTLMIGPERWDAPMMYEGVFDKPVVHHTMSHNQKRDGYKALQKIDLFHMELYAHLLSRMKEIKEADGSSLWDNSIAVCGVGLGDGATHQYFDLPMIVSGGAQGGLRHGRQIQVANGTPVANVWLTIAQQMGVEIDAFSDSTGTLSELSG